MRTLNAVTVARQTEVCKRLPGSFFGNRRVTGLLTCIWGSLCGYAENLDSDGVHLWRWSRRGWLRCWRATRRFSASGGWCLLARYLLGAVGRAVPGVRGRACAERVDYRPATRRCQASPVGERKSPVARSNAQASVAGSKDGQSPRSLFCLGRRKDGAGEGRKENRTVTELSGRVDALRRLSCGLLRTPEHVPAGKPLVSVMGGGRRPRRFMADSGRVPGDT